MKLSELPQEGKYHMGALIVDAEGYAKASYSGNGGNCLQVKRVNASEADGQPAK